MRKLRKQRPITVHNHIVNVTKPEYNVIPCQDSNNRVGYIYLLFKAGQRKFQKHDTQAGVICNRNKTFYRPNDIIHNVSCILMQIYFLCIKLMDLSSKSIV